MRVLLLTGSAARYMAPPVLGDEQITGGPDWADDCGNDGTWRSLQTPVGEYDVAPLLAKLPPGQQPDVLACLVDASWRNLPRNLGVFRGPKVLLVADTHHLQAPLTTMIRYAATEPFDRLVFLYDRQHAAIFHAAGFRNLFWFPGLTFPHTDAMVRASWRQGSRLLQVGFVGQAGKFHPRRTRLLSALTAARLPLVQKHLAQQDALPFYGSSLLGFNSSLNGDLNLRVFEILASGALLLTDRLAPVAGLDQLLASGPGAGFYASEGELVEKAAHFLRQPREAQALGDAGARWFLQNLGEEARRRLFRELAMDGRSPAPFPLPEKELAAVHFDGTRDLLANVMVYEGVQELHRTQENVRVALDRSVPENFAQLCATLPRVKVERDQKTANADLLVSGMLDASAAAGAGASRVWCWDAGVTMLPELAAQFARAGYTSGSNELAIFCRTEQAGPSPAAQAAQARVYCQRGDYSSALELARTAFQRNPQCVEAVAVLADLALLKNDGALAEKLLRQACALAPRDSSLVAALAESLLVQKKHAAAETAIEDALRLNPAELRALLALARLREIQVRPADAVEILRQALLLHPTSTEAAGRLGIALRRQGQLIEGLDWQRRALGADAGVVAIPPGDRPVRVAFLVQHPQGWTSLESVWRAMADDADFAPVVIAAPYQHPYPSEGGPEAIYPFLEKLGVPFTRWDRFPLKPDFADVIFVQNPYDVTRPAPLHVPNLLKLVPRLAYVPYGLEIGGGDRNNAMVMNLQLQQVAWLVCARSERQRQAYARHCQSGNAHVAVTGHAKLDALRGLASVDTTELTRFAAGRKLVGWNPHFDLRPKKGSPWGEGFSTFLRWWDFLLGEFTRRPDLAFVIRPHPLFFGTLESRQIWSRTQTAEFMRRVDAAGNIFVDRAGSYLPLFAGADAMLSDASSFVLEFSATGKPLLYLHNPDGPQLNDDGEFVRSHLYTAEREVEITGFLDQVARGEDPRGPLRRQVFPEYMHLPPAGVGQAVKQAILDRLAREAPAPAVELAAT